VSGYAHFCPETKKTDHEPGIPATIFQPILNFFDWNWSLHGLIWKYLSTLVSGLTAVTHGCDGSWPVNAVTVTMVDYP
jgi:hypothetical protein